MKRYKLIKDLPTFNAGDMFELREDGCLWLVDTSEEGHWKKNVMAYHKHTLEAFPNILEDWFEEIRGFWCIKEMGNIDYVTVSREGIIGAYKRIGNYFETREEAELAVRKLKAWKRLKDKGFRFDGWNGTKIGSNISYISEFYYEGCTDDMDLLFGGEE